MSSDHIPADHEDNKSISRHLTLWMGILIVSLVILNVIFFIVFRESHLPDPPYLQIWNYLDSDVFKGITASLVTPIAIFFIETRLKLLESFQESRKRQRELEEKALLAKESEAKERMERELKEQQEKQSRLQDLVERHLVQFEESISSLWYRLFNLALLGGRTFMNSKGKDDYYLYSTLYSLACLLAYKRIFLVDGIYAKMDLCRDGLGGEIKEKLEVISSDLDTFGKKFGSHFFRYHQLALAESVMGKENDHYELTTYTEFRKRNQSENSIDYALIAPARDFIEFLGREKDATHYEKLLIMKSLKDILTSLTKYQIVEISVKKKHFEMVDEELKKIEESRTT